MNPTGCYEDELAWGADPYGRPVYVQGHRHSEPICAWPDCQTYLTRADMARLHAEAEVTSQCTCGGRK